MKATGWVATGCAVLIIFWIWLAMLVGIAASGGGAAGALVFLVVSGFVLWLVVSQIVASKRTVTPPAGQTEGPERPRYTRRDLVVPPTTTPTRPLAVPAAIPGGRKALLRPLGWIDAKLLRLANESAAATRTTSAEVRTGATTFWVAASTTLPPVAPGAASDVGGFMQVERPTAAPAEAGAVFPLARVGWRNPDGTTGSSGWQPIPAV